MRQITKSQRWGLLILLVLAAGCGGATESSRDTPVAGPLADAEKPRQFAERTPPVAAITRPGNEVGPVPARVTAEPGSPEALLLLIAEEVAAANAAAERQQQNSSGDTTTSATIGSDDIYRRHLERVVELATDVIAATHLDPAAEQSFNNAVHYLSDARLELASTGDAAQARLLIDDADSLYERDQDSFAAAEAGDKVVELAERMARTLGDDDPEWLTEYATQAQRFAERFPGDSRAALGLFTAGRLCDRFGSVEPARVCLQTVQEEFPGTVFAAQSAGFLRRLTLRGRALELQGATIDGGFADIDHYKGKAVLVVFWSSTSPTFAEHLPQLQQVESRYPDHLAFIGINLDTDESALDAFLSAHQIAWPQIVSADPSERGGRHPLARDFGIQVLPTYWLVDAEGIVVDESLSIGELAADVENLVH
jgi:thiol-disulfide isomerase/thioredoxin